ncbi:MAG: hypothetical protein J2P27_01050 [Actinobacteria bacterium]|nr:hypothetical protein [Actinomycetota bacterium]
MEVPIKRDRRRWGSHPATAGPTPIVINAQLPAGTPDRSVPRSEHDHVDAETRRLRALRGEPTELIRRRRWVLESKLRARREAELGPLPSPETERLINYVAAHRAELRRRRDAERAPWRWSA